jgi:carbamate kinase
MPIGNGVVLVGQGERSNARAVSILDRLLVAHATCSPPAPRQIFGIEPVRWMPEHDCIVICAGGGGIPVMYTDDPAPAGRRLVGVEAVIVKDLASALLAAALGTDVLAIVTDVDAVYSDWGTPQQAAIRRGSPEALGRTEFAAGSRDRRCGPRARPSSRPAGWRRSARSRTPRHWSAVTPERS